MKSIEFIDEYRMEDGDLDWQFHDNHGVLVRCRECKYNYVTTRNHGKQDNPVCDFTDRKLTLNDYCSRGEKREDTP